MKNSKYSLGEYVSIREGLSELESDFLSEELQKDSSRRSSVLRRVAKRRAIVQQVKWKMQDTMLVVGLAIVVFGIVGIILISAV
ncbi:hypothetical protein [Paenibacillus abyssi]|uniref:Uncharacterized protein n=1 Tax=Paenibacillus abyssi TaxID=1340531 RepID=A0A917G1H5_9BACL|nr:hypothetical protein [Paenibacillus abyssi]GGG18165.1 hypothetical protein GCM10010916_38720 [Paenibacillus abyssi]